ncbi:unnamed protein product [Dibothriocephalus latus]|uniref:BTB domain-containing protein n=1 Tax=Dibothriocephalus latus TaxID=60516 RepID=A0A3P7LCH6_DIBLA|nr:unnamed protein product [Dibothriocephalus latus]
MAHEEAQVFGDEPALILCLPKLNELRMAGELTDLAIELQDHVTLHVHSVVLVSRVPSLHNIVCGTPRKRLPFSLQWPTVSSEAAIPLLDYVYTGKLEVNGANAEADTWNFARLVDGDHLTDACLQYIKTNFEPTIVSDFFTQLPVDAVLSLLRADDLRVEREENVFEAIKLWVSPGGEVDDVRVVHAAELMREVRWNRVNPEFRYDLLEKKGFWSTNVECL